MRKSWTKQEENILSQIYPQTPYDELMRRFNCTKSALFSKASKLGLRATNKPKKEKIYQSYIVSLFRYDGVVKRRRIFTGRVGKGSKKTLIKEWNKKYDRYLKCGFYYISITHNLECYEP